MDIVDKERRWVGRLIDRPAASKCEICERVERTIEFGRGLLAPDGLAVEKEHDRLWRYVDAERVKVLNRRAVWHGDLFSIAAVFLGSLNQTWTAA